MDLTSGPHCIQYLEYEHMRGRKGPPSFSGRNCPLNSLSLPLFLCRHISSRLANKISARESAAAAAKILRREARHPRPFFHLNESLCLHFAIFRSPFHLDPTCHCHAPFRHLCFVSLYLLLITIARPRAFNSDELSWKYEVFPY